MAQSKAKPASAPKSSGNPFLTGLMLGFLLGVVASLAVIMFVKSSDSPFAVQSVATETKLADQIAADTRRAQQKAKEASKDVGKLVDDAKRFDFYSILPGTETKVSIEEASKLVLPQNKPLTQGSYYLQVSAFKSESEADNLKAKLALYGVEAKVQAASIPEKGVWHRVRVGPLSGADEINRTKANLSSNGYNADLIKIDK
jgi:cell division protein FtsN